MKNIAKKAGAGVGTAGGAVVGGAVGVVGAVATGGALTPAIKAGADIGAKAGKQIGKAVGETVGKIKKNKRGLSDPIGYFLEKAIVTIVSFVIPLPLVGDYAGEFAAKNKFQIGVFLFSILTFFALGLNGNIITSAQELVITNLPEELEGYIEEGFIETEMPYKSPLGGVGYEYTYITSGFYDMREGGMHSAIDIVPAEAYYQNSEAYKVVRDIIVLATHNGSTETFVDINGAIISTIINESGTVRTGYAHLKTSFVNNGDYVISGVPIGVMGSTGKSTGIHLHYTIEIKNEDDEFEFVDPEEFIF